MLWEILNKLRCVSPQDRAVELRRILQNVGDAELLQFHCEACSAFKMIFNKNTYLLYASVYEGETNGMGLRDFCCNVILGGKALYDMILHSPDDFVGNVNIEQFNDEYETDVLGVVRQELTMRHGSSADVLIERAGADSLRNIWRELESQVGSITFEIDWNVIAELMPRIYKRKQRP